MATSKKTWGILNHLNMLDLTHLLIFPFTFTMGIKEEHAKIVKEIEKITTQLNDLTALTVQQRQTKKNRIANLRAQLAALQAQLPQPGIKKIVHQ